MKNRGAVLLLSSIIFCAGCTTTVETKPYNSFLDVPPPAPGRLPGKPQGKQPLSGKGIFGGMQAVSATATNGAVSAVKGVGDGAGWVAGEFLKPLNAAREGLIDTFGVEEKKRN